MNADEPAILEGVEMIEELSEITAVTTADVGLAGFTAGIMAVVEGFLHETKRWIPDE